MFKLRKQKSAKVSPEFLR